MSQFLPLCCNEAEMREAAAKICRDFLNGAWKTVSSKDLDFRRISGGLSNFLYYVALPDKVVSQTPLQTLNNQEDPSRQIIANGEDKSTFKKLLGNSFTRQSSFQFREPNKVLIRIYGQSERGVDNIIMDSVIFTLLSERRLGPRLHGVFSGGRIEEFIPARQLTTRELAEPSFSMKIAEKMAAIHSMDVPLCKEPQWLWNKIGKWLLIALENIDSHNSQDKHETNLVKKLKMQKLGKEVKWLQDYLQTIESPVVFCHNDLQEGNILIREDIVQQNDETNDDLNVDYSAISHDISSDSFVNDSKEDFTVESDPSPISERSFTSTLKPGQGDDNLNLNTHKTKRSSFSMDVDCNTTDSLSSTLSDGNGEPRLVLIDYEYCSYNHRGFDLANHFIEWAYDYTKPEYPFFYEKLDQYPTLEQKEIFMKQYLTKINGDDMPSVEEINQLNAEVEAYSLASHLFWCLWAIVNASQSQIPFGYWDYAVCRLDWYLTLKQEIIKNGPDKPAKRKIREVDI